MNCTCPNWLVVQKNKEIADLHAQIARLSAWEELRKVWGENDGFFALSPEEQHRQIQFEAIQRKREVVDLQARLDGQTKATASALVECESLRERLAQAEERGERLFAACAEYKGKLAQAEAERAKLEARLSVANAECKEAKADGESDRALRQQAQAALTQAQADLARVTAERDEAQAGWERAAREREDYQAERDRTQEELERMADILARERADKERAVTFLQRACCGYISCKSHLHAEIDAFLASLEVERG